MDVCVLVMRLQLYLLHLLPLFTRKPQVATYHQSSSYVRCMDINKTFFCVSPFKCTFDSSYSQEQDEEEKERRKILLRVTEKKGEEKRIFGDGIHLLHSVHLSHLTQLLLPL